MDPRKSQGGVALMIAAIVLAIAAGAMLVAQASSFFSSGRGQASERALAQAREALLAHASDRPITAIVGPGFLPCPDLDDDGWAESTCGSLSGDRGQDDRLGRLPWKTLGLPDLRDGHGERLWYAVSTRYKGLLNCAASAACVDHTPATAFGTITVRDSSGRVMHDGTLADGERGGAAAVIIAPGPPLAREAGSGAREQRRECATGDCDAHGRCIATPPRRAARCDPANYLDLAPPERSGEDNADFRDRSDAGRALNGNGFIQGPVADSGGRIAVNDRLAVVAYADVMPRVTRRVGLELSQCLALYASRPENSGRLPRASPACPGVGTAGRIPDAAFEVAHGMLDDLSWWRVWKPFALYAPSTGATTGADCASSGDCLEVADAEGRVIAEGRRAAIVVGTRRDECGSPRLACDASSCTRIVSAPLPGRAHDAVIALQ